MAFLTRRTPRGPGRFLDWKIRLIAIGAVFLLVGMVREMDLLVLVALVFLVGAFLLRFFEKDPPEEHSAEADAGFEVDAAGHARRDDGETPMD